MTLWPGGGVGVPPRPGRGGEVNIAASSVVLDVAALSLAVPAGF
jgi:hypothetical protein